ncbi:pyrroloquinoline quinone biosynthesis protein C, partial [Xanthomonas sp. Kuri4-1]
DYVKRQADTVEKQAQVKAALHFKCGVLWSQLDALHFAYVSPRVAWPDAFVPAGEPAAPRGTA